MGKLFGLLAIILFSTTGCTESYPLKAEKGIEASIVEDLIGSDGAMSINNNGDEEVEILLLHVQIEPESRNPIFKQYSKIRLAPGQSQKIRIINTKTIIYGIGVVNKSTGKPYEIHQFKWSS